MATHRSMLWIKDKNCEIDRSSRYKKPITKDNYKLGPDHIDNPQELRRQRFLEIQKR